MSSQSSLLGAAGEHYILSQLLRRGYIAALAPQGVPNTDIVITDLEGQRLSAIQVKTRRDIGSDKGWHMKEKHELIKSESLFYCFVDFGVRLTDKTVTYVVPSKTVADVLAESHRVWLRKLGKQGQAHNDTAMRRFMPDYTRIFGPDHPLYGPGWLTPYEEAWQLLGPLSRVPFDEEEFR